MIKEVTHSLKLQFGLGFFFLLYMLFLLPSIDFFLSKLDTVALVEPSEPKNERKKMKVKTWS